MRCAGASLWLVLSWALCSSSRVLINRYGGFLIPSMMRGAATARNNDTAAHKAPLCGHRRIVSILDTAKGNWSHTMSQLLKCNISANATGVQIEDKESYSLLYISYDDMYASSFCGARAADFASSASDIICVPILSAEVSSNFTNVDSLIRRIVHEAHCRASNRSTHLIVLVDQGDEDPLQLRQVEKLLLELAASEEHTQSESGVISDESTTHSLNWTVVPLTSNSNDKSHILNRISSVFEDYTEGIEIENASSTLFSLLSKWKDVTRNPFSSRPLLTPTQSIQLVNIEKSFAEAVSRVDRVCALFRSRLAARRTVGRFGERVDEALRIISDEFLETLPSNISKEIYAEKLQELYDYFRRSIMNLFLLQQNIAEQNSFKSARNYMLEFLQAKGQFPIDIQSAVEEASRTLRDEIVGLKPSLLEFNVSHYLDVTADRLANYCAEFPRSPEGRLELLKQAEKSEHSGGLTGTISNHRHKFPSLKFSFGLVAMVRPPGTGNLQAVFNYATELMRYPVNFVFGIENNGDQGDDIEFDAKEVPIVRVQPKIHVDIDF